MLQVILHSNKDCLKIWSWGALHYLFPMFLLVIVSWFKTVLNDADYPIF